MQQELDRLMEQSKLRTTSNPHGCKEVEWCRLVVHLLLEKYFIVDSEVQLKGILPQLGSAMSYVDACPK